MPAFENFEFFLSESERTRQYGHGVDVDHDSLFERVKSSRAFLGASCRFVPSLLESLADLGTLEDDLLFFLGYAVESVRDLLSAWG